MQPKPSFEKGCPLQHQLLAPRLLDAHSFDLALTTGASATRKAALHAAVVRTSHLLRRSSHPPIPCTMRIPIPPKPLPSPPPLAIPEDHSAAAVNIASQPLCTPSDQPVTRNLNTIASPRRTAPKRRRALDEASQRDLPDMSQDTLALFPTIVREHSRAASPQRKRRVRACLAKASLISTLSASEPLRNPFLTEQPHPNKDGSKVARAKPMRAGASESFQNLEPILEEVRATDHFSGRVATRVKNKSDDMKRLKLRLVSSSQGRKFSLDFEQKGLAGRGAFSEVWQVVHRLDGCTYAVKKNITPMHTDQARWDSLQEVFALSALQNHPNVLRYYDAWFEEKGKYLYIQAEYIPGGSLYSQYVQQKIPMPAAELHSLAADLSCALFFMHSKGVAHLDVKPDNIFRSDRGLGRRSYILGDFGLACHNDGMDARTTEGDARYLRPEAMTESSRGAKKPRKEQRSDPNEEEPYSDLRAGDVFSLGASLYELGIGVPLEKNGRRLSDDRESLMKMAQELQVKCGSEVIGMIARRCLEPDPSLRATAEQIREMCRLGMDSNKESFVKEVNENIELRAKLRQYESFARNLICMGEAGREYFRRKYRSDMHLNLPG